MRSKYNYCYLDLINNLHGHIHTYVAALHESDWRDDQHGYIIRQNLAGQNTRWHSDCYCGCAYNGYMGKHEFEALR